MLRWSRVALIGGFALLAVVNVSSCMNRDVANNELKHTYVMGNESLVLSDAQIKALEPQALKGSAEAAERLCDFYDFIRNDYAESMFWAQIAAENGGHINEYNYGFMLRGDPNPRNQQRARFWLERAAKNGDKKAEELLKKLPE